MSDFASVVERARRAFASVAKLESALARDPSSVMLQVNLAASKKLATKSQDQLFSISEYQRVEVCNYRLIPESWAEYGLAVVAKSFLEYQNLFSQIYDAKKNGPKLRAQIGSEAQEESLLELAYTYSGSLGVVLLAHSERDLFSGKLDSSIQSLLDVTEIKSSRAVKDIRDELGLAVVKRVHDWSKANLDGGFSTDLLWKRSDGRQLGRVVDRDEMGEIVDIIEATSDEKIETITALGILVGGDLKVRGGTFHFVVPNGEDYRGALAEEFTSDTEMTLGRSYVARIREKRITVYSTEKELFSRELLSLSPSTTLI